MTAEKKPVGRPPVYTAEDYNRVVELSEVYKWSLREIAEETGISKSQIHRILAEWNEKKEND